MAFGREIDNIARIGQSARLKYEHSSWLHLIPLASGSVGFKVLRISVLELKCNAAPHNTDTVDSIDQRFGVFSKYVAFLVFDHMGLHSLQ